MGDRSNRLGLISGIAFPILLFVGFSLLTANGPDTSQGSASKIAQDWLKVMGNSGDRLQIIIGGFVMVVAALSLIWFAAALRERFAISATSPLFGFALLGAVGIAAAMIGPTAIAGGHAFGSEPLPADGTVIWFITDLTYPALFVIFGFASSAFITAFLLGTKGKNVVPAWLAGFGWLAVVAGIVGVLFIPIVIALLWYLALGIYGLRRPATVAEPVVAPA
jgi:hypothetical protein